MRSIVGAPHMLLLLAMSAPFDEAIRLNPTSPFAFSNRCFARGSLNQFEQALADCSEALRLKPNNPGAFGSRAFIHLKLRHYEAAIADYNLKLRATPDVAYALFGSASR